MFLEMFYAKMLQNILAVWPVSKTNLLLPSGAPGNCSRAVSLLQAKTGWSTPHGGCSPEDGG